MIVHEAIMTTGFALDKVESIMKSTDLVSTLNNLPYQDAIDSPNQLAVDIAGALNRVIKGNSTVAVPMESTEEKVIVKLNGTPYDIYTGKKYSGDTSEIDTLRYTNNTYAIEDAIRKLCRPRALSGEEKDD